MLSSIFEQFLKKRSEIIDIDESDIETFRLLNEFSKIILIVFAADDAFEVKIHTLVVNKLHFIPKHRLLFHETEIGKIAIVRQVQPYMHIDGEWSSI